MVAEVAKTSVTSGQRLEQFRDRPTFVEDWEGAAEGVVEAPVDRDSKNGEEPHDRPVHFNDVLATIYHRLGIAVDRSFNDSFGRPFPILYEGRPSRNCSKR